ncbi:MAG: CoA transferase, partial [Deltaproteobacteria bacterium]|nr:CoA transferase [Deltaproteobacteria bacterium]
MPPLSGVRVLDFTTLLPGPMATLLLAEAGAEVIKVERPGLGEEMRHYPPRVGPDSANFILLNRGKRCITVDLKAPDSLERLRPLVESADVLVEQFRPGVMARLGLGYSALNAINPRLIYCSITGYGQTGPKSGEAGHDLNYMAESGVLGLGGDDRGQPGVPPALVADVAGGSYPAVMNILLALRQRDQTGQGSYLDIAMTDNLFPFAFWALGGGEVTGRAPRPGGELLTGGSPRYRVYRTRDGRYLAVGALEQKFWETFCALIALPESLRDDRQDPRATREAVSERIAAQPASYWEQRFAGQDVCCTLVRTLEEALNSPQFQARGVFKARVRMKEGSLRALPVPIVPEF